MKGLKTLIGFLKNMLEINKENKNNILKGLYVLDAISEYDPMFEVGFKDLCLRTSDAKYQFDNWPFIFIDFFLSKILDSYKYYKYDSLDAIDTLSEYDLLEGPVESFFESEFSLDYFNTNDPGEAITAENIRDFPDIFSSFCKYIESEYEIYVVTIESPFLYCDSSDTEEFVQLLPRLWRSEIGDFPGSMLDLTFKLNHSTKKGECVYIMDGSDDSICIDDSIYVKNPNISIAYFIKHIRALLKKRQLN